MKKSIWIISLFCSCISVQGQLAFGWASQFSGIDSNIGEGICTDLNGFVYTTGHFRYTTTFGSGENEVTLVASGSASDIFVAKQNADGDVIWALQFGGAGINHGTAINTDSEGYVYITGGFRGTVDFDPGPDVYNLTSASWTDDIFITKLDAEGNFIWAKRLGGSHSDIGTDIQFDASGNVYLTGQFRGNVDFDPGPGTFPINSSHFAAFILKLNNDGEFVWVKAFLSSNNPDSGKALALDEEGNIYLTGSHFGVTDFDPGPGVMNITSQNYDIFLLKLNSDGELLWVKTFGSIGWDSSDALSIDTDGNLVIAGRFHATVSFGDEVDTSTITSSGTVDVFVAKYTNEGELIWVRNFAGNSYAWAYGVAIDNDNNIYTTGYFQGIVDFDPGDESFNISGHGWDCFVSKLGPDGNFIDAVKLGGNGTDSGLGIALDNVANVYTIGYFSGTGDFDPGEDVFSMTTPQQSSDVFVTKLTSSNLGLSNQQRSQNNQFFTLFPNPGNGDFTLLASYVLSNAKVTVTDLTGKVIFQNRQFNSKLIKVDLIGHPKGIYLIKIEDGNYSYALKAIKM